MLHSWFFKEDDEVKTIGRPQHRLGCGNSVSILAVCRRRESENKKKKTSSSSSSRVDLHIARVNSPPFFPQPLCWWLPPPHAPRKTTILSFLNAFFCPLTFLLMIGNVWFPFCIYSRPQDFRPEHYVGPRLAVETVCEFIAVEQRSKVTVVDVAAGTGLVGLEVYYLFKRINDVI